MRHQYSPPRRQDAKKTPNPAGKNRPSFFFLASWRLGGEIFLLLLFFCGSVYADQQGGQRPAAYLELGAGGIQDSMAGAAVGMRDNVANSFWNPAGLSGLTSFQVETQSTLLSLNQEMYYVALANQYRDKIFYGLTFLYYSAGNDIEARTGPTFSPDSLFGDTELNFMVSLAFRLDRQWTMGFNAKIFTQSLNSFSGFGAGEDLGMQFRVNENDTFGFVVQDPLSFFSYSNSSSTLFPITLKAGVSHAQEDLNAVANFDLDWSNDLGLIPRLGLEWKPLKALAIRGGCWAGNLTAGTSGGAAQVYFTGGLGILVPLDGVQVGFDYAVLTDRVISGALIHQFSLTGKFF